MWTIIRAVVILAVIAGVVSAALAVASLVDDWHYILVPVVLMLGALVALGLSRSALGTAQSVIDWKDNRQMRLDEHAIAMDKKQRDIALVAVHGSLVPRDLLANGALLQQTFALAMRQIENGKPVQPVPNSFHYEVHPAIGEAVRPVSMPALLADVAQFATPPTFTEMFDGGLIHAGAFVLGYTQAGEPLNGSIKDIYSNLIIAKSGAGKTTLQRYLMAQAALDGARIWIADPHGETDEGLVAALQPLERYFACKPAVEVDEITALVTAFVALGEARIKGRNKDKSTQILAIDELNVIAEDAPNVVVMIIRAARAYRKVGMYVSASCQSALAADLGGTSGVRASFVARYVLKADKDAVGRLIPDRKLLEMVPSLERGRAIFVPANGEPQPLAIPNTTVNDLRECFDVTEFADGDGAAELAEAGDDDGENEQNEDVPGAQVVDTVPLQFQGVSAVVPQPQKPELQLPDGKSLRIIQMYMEEVSKSQIIAEVFGIENHGRAWQRASDEIDKTIRDHVRRLS